MNVSLPLTTSLALSALLLTAQAQVPATSPHNATPARPTPKKTTGAVGSKNLGQRMLQKSKPTDSPVRVPVPPVKQR